MNKKELLELGIQKIEDCDYISGEKYLIEALSIEGDNSYIYYQLGRLQFRLKMYFKSLEYYEKSEIEGFDNYKIYTNIACTKIRLGLYSSALEYSNKAIAICGDEKYMPYANRGIANLCISKYRDAINDFNVSLVLKNSMQLYYLRGICFTYVKEYKNAIDDFSQALELVFDNLSDNNIGKIYFKRGVSKIQNKEYNSALADLLKAVELQSSQGHLYYFELGNAKAGIGDYSGSIESLSKAIEMLDEVPSDYFAKRGDMKYITNDYIGAIQDYEESIKINPKQHRLVVKIENSKNALRRRKMRK